MAVISDLPSLPKIHQVSSVPESLLPPEIFQLVFRICLRYQIPRIRMSHSRSFNYSQFYISIYRELSFIAYSKGVLEFNVKIVANYSGWNFICCELSSVRHSNKSHKFSALRHSESSPFTFVVQTTVTITSHPNSAASSPTCQGMLFYGHGREEFLTSST